MICGGTESPGCAIVFTKFSFLAPVYPVQQGAPKTSRISSVLEFLAVVGPIICLVDCLVIPAACIALPLIGIHSICHGVGDQILTAGILALCAPGLLTRYMQHRKKRVLALAALGFALIFMANLAGVETDGTMHVAVTVIGSLLLIKANSDNKRYSKGCDCHHQHEPVPVAFESEPHKE